MLLLSVLRGVFALGGFDEFADKAHVGENHTDREHEYHQISRTDHISLRLLDFCPPDPRTIQSIRLLGCLVARFARSFPTDLVRHLADIGEDSQKNGCDPGLSRTVLAIANCQYVRALQEIPWPRTILFIRFSYSQREIAPLGIVHRSIRIGYAKHHT